MQKCFERIVTHDIPDCLVIIYAYKDLPKFVKKWKIPPTKQDCTSHWKNRRYLHKTECPVISH
jgi:hypothetical protein